MEAAIRPSILTQDPLQAVRTPAATRDPFARRNIVDRENENTLKKKEEEEDALVGLNVLNRTRNTNSQQSNINFDFSTTNSINASNVNEVCNPYTNVCVQKPQNEKIPFPVDFEIFIVIAAASVLTLIVFCSIVSKKQIVDAKRKYGGVYSNPSSGEKTTNVLLKYLWANDK